MNLFIELTHDEIVRDIPYQIIAETTESARWNTGRCKRLYSELFTDEEKKQCSRIRSQARLWAFVHGVPNEGVKVSVQMLKLWHKLGEFCASI